MQKFDEVAVIRGIKNWEEAEFLLGFLRFSGISTVEYVYNALPYFFPSNEGGATAIRQVDINATSFGKTYSVNGMVSYGHGIVIQNGKKYINSKL